MSSEPLILAFDTSAPHVAAALLSGDKIISERIEPMQKGQAERLFSLLEELLTEAKITWSDLSAIGVGVGPGNFTGIRISVSAARGLSLSLGIPAVGVSSFEAQAIDLARPVTSIIDARREMVYIQELSESAESLPELINMDELLIRTKGLSTVGPMQSVSVVAIARIAKQRYTEFNLARPTPLYVRAPDAAPPRDPAPVILP